MHCITKAKIGKNRNSYFFTLFTQLIAQVSAGGLISIYLVLTIERLKPKTSSITLLIYPTHHVSFLYVGVRYISVSHTLEERFARFSCVALPFYPEQVRYLYGDIR